MIPKSSTRTRPSAAYAMLPGLMSRCTSPRAWAASSADATWRPTSTTSSTGSGPARQLVGQAGPGQQLHDDVGGVVLDAGVVHRDDVGAAEPGGGAASRSTWAAPDSSRRVREVDGLDGHLAPEHRVGGARDLAHPTAPDRRLEDVATGQSSLLALIPDPLALP